MWRFREIDGSRRAPAAQAVVWDLIVCSHKACGDPGDEVLCRNFAAKWCYTETI
jgi:hypothetical protein